jgi:hypothetical protein
MNWNEFLNKTEYTEAMLQTAYNLASDWVTCACGKQDKRIPRYQDGKPRDIELCLYGIQFNRLIAKMYYRPLHFAEAKQSAKEIKQRLTYTPIKKEFEI